MAYLMQHKARRLAYYSNSSHARSSSPDKAPHETSVGGTRHIERIDVSAPLKTVIAALEEDGCVVINDFAGTSTLDKVSQELKSWLEGLNDEKSKDPSDVHTFPHLLPTSTTTRETVLSNGRLQAVLDHFLSIQTRHYIGSIPITSTTQPTLSSAAAISLTPGLKSQPLQRPDASHHARHVKSATYSVGRDVSLAILIPTADTTRSTGAPHVVPGSHLWGDGQPLINDDNAIGVELEKGDALVTLGSLYQGLGSFRTGEKREQKVYLLIDCINGTLRPEDEDLMKIPDDVVSGWGDVTKRMLGR
ncbi:uncharacterized protein AB675_7637 [Cyphellophora attinorum]|uniref:Phytanoyl-CoA dioxygenase domain-containing protein 1 n=1 Tax=Cyphellophora attinorum TaxID=1664694 RepID=A0A0N1H4N4_9EURO|nr:uncharacterized protein AB675_7637 [Phialophora attinorum]KPI40284.1 hypothetical protein AB675_7637 [Phialophora attinorum]